MIRRTPMPVAAVFALAAAAGDAAPLPPPPRVALPIAAVVLSDGTRRYTVPVTVDGATLAAGLDTGSTGLRVLARAVPAAAVRGRATTYGYSSGLRIDGMAIPLPVALGGAAAVRVPIQRIDRIGCEPGRAGCPGDRLALADYGLQGDGLAGEGFAAIVGLGMADGDVPNPLLAAGATRWIVELPRPGDDAPGRLVIDPDDAEVAGYVPVPLVPALAGARRGVHDAVAGCLVRTDTRARLCGPLLFDSGAPGLRVSLPGFRPWPAGTPGLLVVGEGAGRQALPFVAGRREQASGMFVEPLPPGALPHISAGLLPYFGWSVLYDAGDRTIALKPRG